MSNQKAKALRKKHPRFIYENFAAKKIGADLKISFQFKIEPNINFAPEIVIRNINQERFNSLSQRIINNLVFHLGLMEIPSYWKATCSPEIVVKTGFLNKKRIAWWKDLLLRGMGEFFYTNKIDFTQPDFVHFKVSSQAPRWERYAKPLAQNKYLALIGGGKDSAVTLEVLRDNVGEIGCLALNPTEASKKIIALFRPTSTVIVKRTVDPRLIELNQKDYLNGHTPFSAYLAFLSAMVATLYGFGAIVVANERSAEEENLIYQGKKINHQYSKTFRFEKLFAQYVRQYLAKNLNYFSLLRPLWEIQIARLFSHHPRYFSLFRSCNEGQKTNSWCCKCPKCLGTFILLYPFLEEKMMEEIFGQNLFEKRSLLPLLKALIGQSGSKPFECVPAQEETLIALYLSVKKAQKANRLPPLLDYFQKEVQSRSEKWEKKVKVIFNDWSEQHLVPKRLATRLKREVNDS
jgi:hypothetical protein